MQASSMGFLVLAVIALVLNPAAAQTYELPWHTVDGGGDMWGYGGDYEISGTIGQPDAGVVMTGGDYVLVGGFWAGVVAAPESCPGDLNCDGLVDFRDINPFVLYLSNYIAWATAYPACNPQNGDVNGDGTYPSFGDINPFVTLLTTNPLPIICP